MERPGRLTSSVATSARQVSAYLLDLQTFGGTVAPSVVVFGEQEHSSSGGRADRFLDELGRLGLGRRCPRLLHSPEVE